MAIYNKIRNKKQLSTKPTMIDVYLGVILGARKGRFEGREGKRSDLGGESTGSPAAKQTKNVNYKGISFFHNCKIRNRFSQWLPPANILDLVIDVKETEKKTRCTQNVKLQVIIRARKD